MFEQQLEAVVEWQARSGSALDGHPVRDQSASRFPPPAFLPQRMWASSKLELLQKLHRGAEIERNSTLSAHTFNSHRIHYDRPYATQAEGYRGLVVHGPLTATLLLVIARR